MAEPEARHASGRHQCMAARRLRVRLPTLSLSIFVLSQLLSSNVVASRPRASSECQALIQHAHDFYSIDPAGEIQHRFTDDGVDKRFLAVSPDGGIVVYEPADDTGAGRSLVLVGENGATRSVRLTDAVANSIPGAGQPGVDEVQITPEWFLQAAWTGHSTLALAFHGGRDNRLFRFADLSGDLELRPLSMTASAWGVDCSSDFSGRRFACATANEVLADGVRLFGLDPMLGAQPLPEVVLALDETASVQGFTVELRALDQGATLRVTLSSGAWTESRLASGDIMTVRDGDHALLLSARPLVETGHRMSSTTAVVTLAMIDSDAQEQFSAIDWSSPEHSMFVLSGAGSGTTLRRVRLTPSAQRVASETIPVSIPFAVRRMRAITPDRLYVEGDAGFGQIDVQRQRAQASPVARFTPLPARIVVSDLGLDEIEVLAWSCSPAQRR